MPATLAPPEQRVVLHNVSWETYDRLLAGNGDSGSPRLTFDHGELEIMSPSWEHEGYNRTLALLFELVAIELGVDFESLGSTTFRREEWLRGTEPDSCFYLRHLDRIRGKKQLDPAVDPAPDLVIEIDITRSSLSKLPIYAQFGVAEVWHHDGDRVRIFRLSGDGYVEAEKSEVLPQLSRVMLQDFIERCRSMSRPAWARVVQTWAREQKKI